MYDDRYGYPDRFDIRRCTTCGHSYLQARFDDSELSTLYTRFYPRAAFQVDQFQVPRESHGIAAWLSGERCAAFRWVPAGVRVLDIGCGACETLGYHKSRGCEAYGVEADENVRHIAAHFGFNVHIGLFDADLYKREFFDYVTLDQVIEHMADPMRTLSGVARILKPGGTVVLSTPNARGWGARVFGRRWINWHVPYHLHHFTPRSMRLLASNAGLHMTDARTLTHADWMYFQAAHVLGVPGCGEKHPFWVGGKWMTGSQRVAFRALSLVRSLRFFEVATRFFDALGMGDNQLFFLGKAASAEME
jgi:2-polyprenyl-3-methyl-5-hydroxy-6-metoxy-1,4-benzoquinol methylase